MDGTKDVSKTSFKCRYCQREFRKESTLTAHLCTKKRRHQQQTETGVQIGFRSYLRFYEVTQGSARLKTYDDFADSPYYDAFVKYGRYLVGIRAVNPTSYTDWLLKNNKKLDRWCTDSYYEQWLLDYLRKENYQDALERAIREMQDYAEITPELENSFNNYFRLGNSNRICYHISTGRISPWVIYNCSSGIGWLDQVNQEQLQQILGWIDPDFWTRKFRDYTADQLHVREILDAAGL